HGSRRLALPGGSATLARSTVIGVPVSAVRTGRGCKDRTAQGSKNSSTLRLAPPSSGQTCLASWFRATLMLQRAWICPDLVLPRRPVIRAVRRRGHDRSPRRHCRCSSEVTCADRRFVAGRGARAVHLLPGGDPRREVRLLVAGEAAALRGLSVLPPPGDLDRSCLASLGEVVVQARVSEDRNDDLGRVSPRCDSAVRRPTPRSLGV